MPFDAKKRFHNNSQRAAAADKAAGTGKEKAAPKPQHSMGPTSDGDSGASGMGNASSTLHENGDGSYKTVGHDGEEVQHPHIGAALVHLGAKHAPGKHFHAMHDGMSITSHHADESGAVQGPVEHGSGAELGAHAQQVMDGDEGGDWTENPPEERTAY